MSLFLYKPHVEGPEGATTTPDIVIDRVFVDGAVKPVNFLCSGTHQQIEDGEICRPAYAVTAIGGGALISPAVVVGEARICVARMAWRLANLDETIGSVTLNGQRLDALRLPADLINAAGGSGDTLPRGYQLLCTLQEPASEALLEDAGRGRSLVHRIATVPVGEDRWGDRRPKPRYSVGPMMKEVQHFI